MLILPWIAGWCCVNVFVCKNWPRSSWNHRISTSFSTMYKNPPSILPAMLSLPSRWVLVHRSAGRCSRVDRSLASLRKEIDMFSNWLIVFFSLQDLLTKHKSLCADFLERNYDPFFNRYRDLLNSENYVTRRQSLKVSRLRWWTDAKQWPD